MPLGLDKVGDNVVGLCLVGNGVEEPNAVEGPAVIGANYVGVRVGYRKGRRVGLDVGSILGEPVGSFD